MEQKFRDMLDKCPYDLSPLARQSQTDKLEEVTGQELGAMFSLASKSSKYKELWSYERSEPPVPPELEETPSGDDCTSNHSSSTMSDFDQQNLPRVASPVPDPSPSPGPRDAYCPEQFYYYLMSFAGLKLPILAVGCFEEEPKSDVFICCYGGSKNGERCFLSGWK